MLRDNRRVDVFSYEDAILDLATVEDWDLCINPLPVKHPRWPHRKLYLLPSVPRQNNACTAEYTYGSVVALMM